MFDFESNFDERPDPEEVSSFWRNVKQEHGACGLGFVVARNEEARGETLALAQEGLRSMENRSGSAFEVGDGAGVMFETLESRAAIERWFAEGLKGHNTAAIRDLGVGNFFFEKGAMEASEGNRTAIASWLATRGICTYGWREVPMNRSVLPAHIRDEQPAVWQLAYSQPPDGMGKGLYRKLLFYAQQSLERGFKGVYPVSLNPDTVTYKYLATPTQFTSGLFEDFEDVDLKPRQVSWHGRMSTNTGTEARNTQPGRILTHNGEFSSDRAQSGAQRDLEIRLGTTLFGHDSPTVSNRVSDSLHVDGIIQSWLARGVNAREALRRIMGVSKDDRWRYDPKIVEWHRILRRAEGPLSSTQGPAAMVLMTGNKVAFAKDPLQLRTFDVYGTDQFLIGSSEVGSPYVSPDDLRFIYSLRGGEIGMVERGKFYPPAQTERRMEQNSRIKITGEKTLKKLNISPEAAINLPRLPQETLVKLWNQVGGERHLFDVIKYIIENGKEEVIGMGDDRPLAVLSNEYLRTAEFFKQIVAVVTNPPIDSLREGDAMDTTTYLGRSPKQRDQNNLDLYQGNPEFKMDSPFMNPVQFEALKQGVETSEHLAHKVIDTTVEGTSGADLETRLKEIIEECIALAKEGKTPMLVFSDRSATDEGRLFVPPVFVMSAVDHALKERGLRSYVSLVVDTADALEAHDMALLVSQGADAVHPYLLWEVAMSDALKSEVLVEDRLKNLEKSLNDTLRQIMAKMGIISVNGYRGSCLFEAIGIDDRISREYLPNNVSQISGIDFDDIAAGQISTRKLNSLRRRIKEAHSHGGQVVPLMNQVALLEKRGRNEGLTSKQVYDKLLEFIEGSDPVYLRDLLELKGDGRRLEKSEVHSIDEIINTAFRGAHMSDGSISPISHAAIAAAFNELAGRMPDDYTGPRAKSGSGEGGEHASRYPGQPLEEACSQAKQIASGRFGVDAYYLMSMGPDGEVCIKIGQGAKPAEGGHLKGVKLNERLAKMRRCKAGIDRISPPPQHDIYSIEDLMRLIGDVRALNPEIKTVSVKITAKAGTGTIVSGIAKCGADKVVISDRSGGTGAAKKSALHHTGGLGELSLLEAHRSLERQGMRNKIKLEIDGGILTGKDIVKLAILGADEFGLGTALLMAGQGCIFCNECSNNNCPTGITTTKAENIARLTLGAQAEKIISKDPEQVRSNAEQYEQVKQATIHYMELMAGEIQEILCDLGVPSLEALRGRVDLLGRVTKGGTSDKVNLDFIWSDQTAPEDTPDFGNQPIRKQERVNSINQEMVDVTEQFLASNSDDSTLFEHTIDLSEGGSGFRTLGATLFGRIASGKITVPKNGLRFKFRGGYAGQSFGFMNVPGVHLELDGIARDFVGNGMCGGSIILRPPEHLREGKFDTPIAGASCAYGASGGTLYAAGAVGQRFGVGSCGDVTLMCESAGKYAFEYMSGGVGVVLNELDGQVGTGMSDGELFLWNEDEKLGLKLHKDSVHIVPMTAEDKFKLHCLISDYAQKTQSPRAMKIFRNWQSMKGKFSKVVSKIIPHDVSETVEGTARRVRMEVGSLPVVGV